MDELWLDVPGLEGRLQVSALGRARSLRVLTPTIVQGTGYLSIVAPGEGSKYSRRVNLHTLVARAFVGPCPPGKEVNHKDGDRTNAKPENLEYLTRSENVQDALDRAGKLLSPEQREKVWEMYDVQGLAMLRIAKILGLSRDRVRSFVTKRRMAEQGTGRVNPWVKKLNSKKVDEIMKMHKAGVECKHIAAAFDISTSHLSRVLRVRKAHVR